MAEQNAIRINRFLSDAGVCSRRGADQLILDGRVTINGEAAVLGSKVASGDVVCLDGRTIGRNEEYKVYAFYKPVGYISSLSDEQGVGVASFFEHLGRVYPVGRLDKESEGLMLFTNDGILMNEILCAAGNHEKEYVVTTNLEISQDFLKTLEQGVRITNKATQKKVMTAPCHTEYIDSHTFRITLIQGLNRQIRRMCGVGGLKVLRLQRVRIMNVNLGAMKPGEIRELTVDEYNRLKELCR